MSSEEKTVIKEKQHRTNVRFSPSEYKYVQRISQKLGLTEAATIRNSILNKVPPKVLVNQDDLATLRKDMNRIGNNLNQVARKLNSGFMHGWSETLDKVLEEFKTLNSLIYYGHGVHKG